MRRFCYKCGALEAEAGQLLGGLCPACFVREVRLIEVPSKIELCICRACGAVKSRGRWNREENAAEREVLRIVSLRPRLRGAPISIAPQPSLMTRVDLEKGEGEIEAVGECSGIPLKEKRRVKLDLKFRTCDVCTLKSCGYHEAVVQVRSVAEPESLEEEIRELALEEERKNPRDFLTDIVPASGGFDVYLSSVSLGGKIATLLKKRGARVRRTRKLIGQAPDGRKKYKFTFLARVRE
jgi:NMD protein affecting ribosome stability and mRNA decay